MRHYKKIFVFENIQRHNVLIEFRNNVVKYFNNIKYDSYLGEPTENEIAQKMRYEININFTKISNIIHTSGISTSMHYSPPPAVGGLAADIDLIGNIFNLKRFTINPQYITDMIDRSIGIYKDDFSKSIIRLINPIFYIRTILEIISDIPFWLLGIVGFNQSAAEQAILGKLFRFFIEIIYLGGIFFNNIKIDWLPGDFS